MGENFSTQLESPVININVKVVNINVNYITINKKKKKKKDRKRKPRLSESKSDEESNVKSDQESRSYISEEEKNDPNVNIEPTSSGQKSKKNNSPMPIKERLALQPTEFYVEKIGMSP